MATLGKFIDICEARGMKVVLDMVVNHAGYGAKVQFDASWFNVGGSGDIKGELAGLPDFNHDNPQVLDYFINNIEDWIIKGKVSNIRMDTAKHVEPKFWYYFKSRIHGQYPEVYLLGEVLFEGKENISDLLMYQNYHDFNSIFDFPLCTALRSTLIYDESFELLVCASTVKRSGKSLWACLTMTTRLKGDIVTQTHSSHWSITMI